MSNTDPTPRTRLENPTWVLNSGGAFTLDLSWTDDSRRWLEVNRDPDSRHGWLLVLAEAQDDSSDAAFETLERDVQDVQAMLNTIAADPRPYDRSPV